ALDVTFNYILMTTVINNTFPSFVFFFQAEDGIRDRNVTGVQTCALPISRDAGSFTIPRNQFIYIATASDRLLAINTSRVIRIDRSEERRVGKECRCRGAPDHQRKK